MSREFYDRTAAEWRAVAEANRMAGGDTIAIPALHLSLLLNGYEQYQRERTATLAWIATEEQAGQLDTSAAAHARHALGELTTEQLADHMRQAGKEAVK